MHLGGKKITKNKMKCQQSSFIFTLMNNSKQQKYLNSLFMRLAAKVTILEKLINTSNVEHLEFILISWYESCSISTHF